MPSGMRTTYSDTQNQIRVITDYIKASDPREIPLINYVGLNNQDKFDLKNFPGTKIEWLEDELAPRTDQLAEALDNSETGVDVDNATYFQPGDVIEVDSELMWVSAVAAPTLTVTRGFAGTTAASHDDDSPVYIRTRARLEGDEADDPYTTTLDNPYNHSQILQKTIIVSGSDLKIKKYGVANEYNRQLMKVIGGGGGGKGAKGKAGELPILLEQAAFYGQRAAGSATTARAMGGLSYYITTNVNSLTNSPALTQKHIEDGVQNAWGYGGQPNLIICNGFAKRKISGFYSGAVRTERREDIGGLVITTIATDFGELDILLNRWCPSNKLFIVDSRQIGFVTIRDFQEEKLAKGGDYEKGHVVGEYSFVVCNQKHHAIVSGFSTSK